MQSFAVANKAIFRNCLVAMRPAATNADLPSAHDISTFIHNSFIKFFDKLRVTIQVMSFILIQNWKLIANGITNSVEHNKSNIDHNRSLVC